MTRKNYKMERLSILFVGRKGAGPKYSFEMTKALLESYPNIKHQVIIPENIDNIHEWSKLEKKFNNIHIHYVNSYSNFISFSLSIVNIFKYLKIANLIKDFNPDWIYMPMGSLLNIGLLPLLKNFRKIYTLHDPIMHVGEKSFFIERVIKTEIKNSDKIILLNNFFKEYVSDHFKISERNINVIPHAAFFRDSEPTYSNSFKYKILFLGRIEKYKGIDLLLDTFEQIIKIIPNLELTIAGKGNIHPYIDKINKIRKKGGRILLINNWLTENEIEDLLEGTDFVILPYIDASQSGVIPIAFGNGRTVLATNVGALAEQIPDGIGFLSEPNVESLSEKIEEIYGLGESEILKISKASRIFALSNLTWEKSVEKLINFIK